MISEFTSIIILLIFMPKHIKITGQDIKPQRNNIKNILSISIPNTNTRLIGNIGYFLEPILLTSGMLAAGYDISYITLEYGIVAGTLCLFYYYLVFLQELSQIVYYLLFQKQTL